MNVGKVVGQLALVYILIRFLPEWLYAHLDTHNDLGYAIDQYGNPY